MKFAPLRKFADGGMTSVVDYAKASGRGSTLKDRKQIAEQLGISNYKGSGKQNLDLLARMQQLDKAVGQEPNGGESPVGDRLSQIRQSYDSIQNSKQAQQPVIRRNVETKPSAPQTTKFVPISQKPTADSSAYYKNESDKIWNAAASATGGGRNATAINLMGFGMKADENLRRQANKGKPGYDANGFPVSGGSVPSAVNTVSTNKVTPAGEDPMAKLRAAGANIVSNPAPQQSWDKNGNITTSGEKLTPFQVMQNKLDAGAFSYDNVGTGNVLQRLGNFTRNVLTEPLLQIGTSAGKIVTGDGDARDAAVTALTALSHGAIKLPGNLSKVVASGSKSEAALDALMTSKKVLPKLINKTAKEVGKQIKNTSGTVISQREGLSPALRNIAGNLDKAEIPYVNQTMANIMTNQALQQGEKKLAAQGLRNMMRNTKSVSNKKVESRLNDLYERSSFKKGGVVTIKKKADGGYINEEDQYTSPSQYVEYMKKGGMKKKR